MQRRAAAVYFVLLVLVGAGALGFVQVGMSQPQVSLDGPALSQNDTLTVDGRTYTVSEVAPESGSVVGQLRWTNDSARMTAALANGSTVSYEGAEYRVAIENTSDVSQFRLVEAQNVSAILASDPDVEDDLFEQGGTQYVRYVDSDDLQPLSEYLPEPDTLTFAAGEDYRYQAESGAVTASVAGVTPAEATLAWTASATNTIGLSEGTNVTLSGQPYLVHFPSNDSVQVLPTEQYYDSYQSQLDQIDYWEERRNGVWGIVILTFLAGLVLLGAAYMPVK